MQIVRPLRGIVPPLVTPLSGPDVLDIPGLERLVDHQLEGGVSGLFLLGTTGEGPSLAYELRRELIRRVVERVAGRVPVLVGVTDTVYRETLRMAEFAAAHGASAIVIAPPYYFCSSQADLLRFVRQLAEDSELPIFLYNMPEMTKMIFEPETVAEAAKLDRICGLKDSSGDLEYLTRVVEIMRSRADFTILVGPEELLRDGMRLGVHGGVHGGANILPRLYVDLYNACLEQDEARIEELHTQVLSLGSAVYDSRDKDYRYIRGIKSALSILGICSDMTAWPYQPAGPALRASIADYLHRHFAVQV